MAVTDARVLELARKHLDQGLLFSRCERITRSTDAELLSFARAVLAEHEAARLPSVSAAFDGAAEVLGPEDC